MSGRARLAIWGLLLAGLGGAIAFLVAAGPRGDGGETPGERPAGGADADDMIAVAVVDADGAPAPWARPLVVDEAAASAARWDDRAGVLRLPRAGAPHRVRFTAPGHRIENLEVATDRTVTLRAGLRVHVDVAGPPEPPAPPRYILLRIRPWTEHAPEDDPVAADEVATVCAAIALVQPARLGSLPEFPTEAWGFAATASDVEAGLWLPAPGTYVLQWGLFHADPATWFTHDEGQAHVIEVEEATDTQHFSLAIDAAAYEATRTGLDQQLAELAAGDEGK